MRRSFAPRCFQAIWSTRLATPRAFTRAMSGDDPGAARRAFEAMMTMQKIDVAAIEAACRGE